MAELKDLGSRVSIRPTSIWEGLLFWTTFPNYEFKSAFAKNRLVLSTQTIKDIYRVKLPFRSARFEVALAGPKIRMEVPADPPASLTQEHPPKPCLTSWLGVIKRRPLKYWIGEGLSPFWWALLLPAFMLGALPFLVQLQFGVEKAARYPFDRIPEWGFLWGSTLALPLTLVTTVFYLRKIQYASTRIRFGLGWILIFMNIFGAFYHSRGGATFDFLPYVAYTESRAQIPHLIQEIRRDPERDPKRDAQKSDQKGLLRMMGSTEENNLR